MSHRAPATIMACAWIWPATEASPYLGTLAAQPVRTAKLTSWNRHTIRAARRPGASIDLPDLPSTPENRGLRPNHLAGMEASSWLANIAGSTRNSCAPSRWRSAHSSVVAAQPSPTKATITESRRALRNAPPRRASWRLPRSISSSASSRAKCWSSISTGPMTTLPQPAPISKCRSMGTPTRPSRRRRRQPMS